MGWNSTLPSRGKKTKGWEAARKKLKVRFERSGVTRCEKCGSGFALSFAHRKKRADVTTPEELETVALLCCVCHDGIEKLSHEEMFAAVDEIIHARETVI